MAGRVVFSFVGLDKFSSPARAIKSKMDSLTASYGKLVKLSRKSAEPYKKLGEDVTGVGIKLSALSAGITAGKHASKHARYSSRRGLRART